MMDVDKDSIGHPEAGASNAVMPGLVPGIHAFLVARAAKAWMAGTSPAMTNEIGRDPGTGL
jgi:hypothetical protein